jgi:hypothetical protein
MKKTMIGLLTLLLVSGFSFGIELLVRGTYLMPSDSAFKDIYGSSPMFGGELGIKIVGGLRLFLGGDYLRAKGQLTYTKEGTTLTLIPAGGGLKYSFLEGAFHPYLAAGVRYYMYKESNPLGTVKKNGPGFLGRAGVTFEFAKKFGVDLSAGYSWCEMKTDDFTINLGGLELAGGLFVRL